MCATPRNARPVRSGWWASGCGLAMSMTASSGTARGATRFFIAWRSMCRTSSPTCRRSSTPSMAAPSDARAAAAPPSIPASLPLHSEADAVTSVQVGVVPGRGELLGEQDAETADLAHLEGRVRRLLRQARVGIEGRRRVLVDDMHALVVRGEHHPHRRIAIAAVAVMHRVSEQFLEDQVQAQAMLALHPRGGAKALQKRAYSSQFRELGVKHRRAGICHAAGSPVRRIIESE